MADVLVDTSVWIDFFRSTDGKAGNLLDTLLAEDRVLLCGVVEMEIFQGLKKKELTDIRGQFSQIPYIETTRDDFVQAGILWNTLRTKGSTIPGTDCLIAAVCLARQLILFSLDAHFDAVDKLRRLRP